MSDIEIPIEDFRPPSLRTMARVTALQRRYFAATLEGAENVDPQRPGLFVGNHALMGVLDSPLFVYELYRQTGVFPRSLGDHFHFPTPVWGKLVTRFGAVPGTRENCRRLMESGQHVLVFPGGAREVAKRRDEINKLVWKKRTGFVYMAIEQGFDIIPFASLGCDEAYDIVYDGDDFANGWLGKRLLGNDKVNSLMRGGDLFMPLVKGIGPTLLPKAEPFHFSIGKPIPTAHLQGQENDPAVLWQLREQVSDAITSMLSSMDEARKAQPRPLWRKVLGARKH
ncbi:MAG: lysophospholipid acyltransferase family protein [Pseudomonadota bacterium]|uniref:lysophospholipid acyltransferase family protein n=1 Tax=unclassified Alcanivorax TaxID=2638842 RepID=UPI00089FF64F|nr:MULTISPECIES: lysophospholipid acyltransferase family protein [unclassified Alcanivorax]MED5239907.1 lysophospholipid acyltransferase family protein [Pseudomonadota bacterium]SEF84267.1 Diacylglycerol acyltransferase [Alcanivorax sp. DSM 26293]